MLRFLYDLFFYWRKEPELQTFTVSSKPGDLCHGVSFLEDGTIEEFTFIYGEDDDQK